MHDGLEYSGLTAARLYLRIRLTDIILGTFYKVFENIKYKGHVDLG